MREFGIADAVHSHDVAEDFLADALRVFSTAILQFHFEI
jgi:hypothetical protein